ncbi:MAG: hypothetical protein AAFY53_05345 [Pseudomonadota bacterium]
MWTNWALKVDAGTYRTYTLTSLFRRLTRKVRNKVNWARTSINGNEFVIQGATPDGNAFIVRAAQRGSIVRMVSIVNTGPETREVRRQMRRIAASFKPFKTEPPPGSALGGAASARDEFGSAENSSRPADARGAQSGRTFGSPSSSDPFGSEIQGGRSSRNASSNAGQAQPEVSERTRPARLPPTTAQPEAEVQTPDPTPPWATPRASADGKFDVFNGGHFAGRVFKKTASGISKSAEWCASYCARQSACKAYSRYPDGSCVAWAAPGEIVKADQTDAISGRKRAD